MKAMKKSKMEEQFLFAYEQFADAIYRYCFFRVANNAIVAEDLVQEAFTKSWQYMCAGNEVKNLRAFLEHV